MVGVSVTVTGDQQLMDKLAKLGPALTNFGPAFAKIGGTLLDFYSDTVFNSQGGALAGAKGISGGQGEGVPWAKLAPSTIAQKTKHYRQYASVPLMATGAMRHSFYFDARSQSLEIGNSSDHFEFHQGDGDRTRLPRRPMLGVNKTVLNLIKDGIETDIREKVAAL